MSASGWQSAPAVVLNGEYDGEFFQCFFQIELQG